MADETVTLDAFEIVLSLETPTLPGAMHTQYPSTFEIALELPPAKAVASFPIIGRKPGHRFSDIPDPNAMLIGSTASGYPVLNKVATFAPRTFTPEFRLVINTDKLLVMTFYKQHKDLEFPWYNDQDDMWYTVAFVKPPQCRLDGRKDLWRIQLELRQTEL